MRRIRPLVGPLVCLVVLGLALVPALAAGGAADQTVVATMGNTWDPPTVDIVAGETVTWTNPSNGYHNVKFENYPFDEPPQPTNNWTSEVKHTFTTAGTYTYYCEAHPNMRGTVRVGSPATQTATQTATATTTATATATATATFTATVAPLRDTFTARVLRTRRRTLVLSVTLASDAARRITGTLRRKRARRYRRFATISFTARRGTGTYRFRRTTRGRRLARGRYALELRLASDATNVRTLRFRIR